MINGRFTREERDYLASLPAVAEVRATQIIYAPWFIRHAMDMYHAGHTPTQIFTDQGLSPKIIGYKRVERCIHRWKQAQLKDILGKTPAPIIKRRNQVDTIKAQKRAAVERQRNMRKKDEQKYLHRIAELEAQVELLKAENAYAKKLGREEKTLTKSDRFQLIHKIRQKNPQANITIMCNTMNVSRSGYYKWVESAPIRQAKDARDLEYLKLIKTAFNAHGFPKGSRQIKDNLRREQNTTMNRKKIQRIMRKHDVVYPYRRKRPYYPIGLDGLPKIAPNLVEQDFRKGQARRVLSTDITYIRYAEGFAYLSAVNDTQTNEILAWELSKSLEMPFVESTIDQLKPLDLNTNTIIHSDQGSHYTSIKYRKKIRELGVTQSMSRRACCWDNASIESFFSRLKEQTPPTNQYTYEELEEVVNNYIVYYNNYRGQERLEWKTPKEYATQLLAA